jgi:hypothetical protein
MEGNVKRGTAQIVVLRIPHRRRGGGLIDPDRGGVRAGRDHPAGPWPSDRPSARLRGDAGGRCTAVAVVLFFALIAEIGPIRSTLVTYFNPAVALLLGGTVLGEPLTVGTVLGLALFLAGSFLTTHAPRAARSRKDIEAEDREAPPDQAFIGSPPEVRARSGGP